MRHGQNSIELDIYSNSKKNQGISNNWSKNTSQELLKNEQEAGNDKQSAKINGTETAITKICNKNKPFLLLHF